MTRVQLTRSQAFKVAALMTQWQATIAEKKLTLAKVHDDLTKIVDFPLTRDNVKRVARDLGIELPKGSQARSEGAARAYQLRKRVEELEARVLTLETSLGVQPKEG